MLLVGAETLSLYDLLFSVVKILDWSIFHFFFYGLFGLCAFKIFYGKGFSTYQTLHLTILSLLTVQQLWEFPMNVVISLSFERATQYYFIISYSVRFIPFMLFTFTLTKFSFHQIKKVLIVGIISAISFTLLFYFILNRFSWLIRFPYAITCLLIINRIKELNQ